MKPVKEWSFFDWAWTIAFFLVVGFNIATILSDDPFFLKALAVLVIACWVWLIWMQLWVIPQRRAEFEAEMKRIDLEYKRPKKGGK